MWHVELEVVRGEIPKEIIKGLTNIKQYDNMNLERG